MQYKCAICHDSGSKNQTGDYLDCPACDMPHTRKALNDFVKSLGPTHPEDVALAIHQRALAMAPKQEADHINDVVKMVAPAGWKLVPVEPTIEMIAALGWGGNEVLAVGHGAISGGIADEYAAMLAAAPAAPSAANGALTDEREIFDRMYLSMHGFHTKAELDKEWHRTGAMFCAALASGPDAALVKALESALAIINNEADPGEYAEPLKAIRAALSGAKGN